MNYNNILICVDDKCECSKKVIDNWDQLLIHQQLSHKILTLNLFYETLKQNQEFQSSEEFQFCLEEDLKENQNYRDSVDMCNDFNDKFKQTMNNFFNEIIEIFAIQFRKQVNQRLDQISIPLEAFPNILFNIPYQQNALQNFQEIQNKRYVNIISSQLLEQLDYQFQLFHQDLNIFLLNQKQFFCQQLNFQEQSKQSSNIYDIQNLKSQPNYSDILPSKTDTFEQITADLPLKNYKNTLSQLNQGNFSIDILQQNNSSVKTEKSSQTESKSFAQTPAINSTKILLFQRKQQDILKISSPIEVEQKQKKNSNQQNNYQDASKSQQSASEYKKEGISRKLSSEIYQKQERQNKNSQEPKIEKIKFFSKPNFHYLNNKVTCFSKKHMYGELNLTDNDEVVSTDSEGFILFQGFIDTKKVTTLKIQVNKKHKDYEIEIGVVDWNIFQLPKLNKKPQRGIYGYNSYGEIFDNGSLKQKKLFFDDNERIQIIYGQQKHGLDYKFENYNSNQAICLKDAHKDNLTFYAYIYKAKITII